jgi:hypothetical protein
VRAVSTMAALFWLGPRAGHRLSHEGMVPGITGPQARGLNMNLEERRGEDS